MTFDDDFVRLNLELQTALIAVKDLGLEWPPPERIYLGRHGLVREATDQDEPEFVLVRASYSQITDEQRQGMEHVARGAEYFYTQ